jgi:Peptidase family M48
MTWEIITALATLVLLPELIRSTKFFDGRPRTGVALWLSLPTIGFTSIFTVALRLALPQTVGGRVGSLRLLLHHVAQGYPLRGEGFAGVIGLAISLDVLVVLVTSYAVALMRTTRARRRQRQLVDLVATTKADNLHVIAHDCPTAYFVPGHGGRVVVSTGTLSLLSVSELDAVIAHEVGHQRGRHATWLMMLSSLSPFVAFVPAVRYAAQQVPALLEMAADDTARQRTSTEAVRNALRKSVGFAPSPAGTVAFAQSVIERRLARLRTAPRLLSDASTASVVLSATCSVLATQLLALH